MTAEHIAGHMTQRPPPGARFQSLDDIGLNRYFVMAVTQFRRHPHGARGAGRRLIRAQLPRKTCLF